MTVSRLCSMVLLASLSFTSAAPSTPLGGPGYGSYGGPGNFGLGSPASVFGPNTLVTTQSNIFANTDIAPQVNIAPTIPIPYAEPYPVPVPIASAYPYPVPTVFKKRWDDHRDDCCDDWCDHDDCCCDDWDDCC
ncbi:hypothetical protein BGW39_007448 [Mortierella sp. 14UC]|nr:hypothetical protein BGW39_007448 [Mortierella sp. 14UC]